MPRRLGEMLIAAGLVTEDQVNEALGRQRRFGGRIGTNLLALGHAEERILARFLSRQQGVPYVVLSRSAIPLDLLREFPMEIANKHKAFPMAKDGRELFIALANPRSLAALDEIRFITGARLVEHGALLGPLAEAIEEAYQQVEFGSTVFWEGVDLDPTIDLRGDVGHIEVVVGRQEDDVQAAPESAAEAAARVESAKVSDEDWIGVLESGFDLQKQQEEEGPDDQKVILLVDDEPDILNMLGSFLENEGYRVQPVADGSQALAQLKQELPDAIVLDAMLPGVHGFDICYRVKNAAATAHIPVIMISAVYRGWRYADDVTRLYGADAFLEKPLRLDELKLLITRALDGRAKKQPIEDLNLKASAALQSAAAAYRKGDLMGAAKHLQDAVEASPFSAQLHHRLGLLYDNVGEKFRAIAELERAAQLEPSFAHVLALAKIYEKTGFARKAFEAWERCLRMSPNDKESENIRKQMERLLP